jgi:hypothetical protein
MIASKPKLKKEDLEIISVGGLSDSHVFPFL